MTRRALCSRRRALLGVPLVLASWGVTLLTAGSVHLAAVDGLTLDSLAGFLLGTGGGGTIFARVGRQWWVLALSLGTTVLLVSLALVVSAATQAPEGTASRSWLFV